MLDFFVNKSDQDKPTGLLKMAFTDDNYVVIVKRHSEMMHLMGYIGVPKSSPLYGKDYDDIDVDIHGGWTYADKFQPGSDVADEVWWIGFDTGHACDLCDIDAAKKNKLPEKQIKLLESLNSVAEISEHCRLWTADDVLSELKRALVQIKNKEVKND